MKTRQWRVFRGGLRFALSADAVLSGWGGRLASADQLDNAGNASPGDVSPTVEESCLRTGHADLTPSDAFPGTEYVALLAMVRFSNSASPCCRKHV